MSVIFFQAYLYNDYWEDIGTIKSFYDANLALTEEVRSRYLLLSSLYYIGILN